MLLTAKLAAETLGVSQDTFRKLRRAGGLKPIFEGYYCTQQLERYLQWLTDEQTSRWQVPSDEADPRQDDLCLRADGGGGETEPARQAGIINLSEFDRELNAARNREISLVPKPKPSARQKSKAVHG